ncbi:DUF2383 domain-containing protein [Algibacter sp. 2305UL17-15]|uniref:DUF2383 domain-containing protein n=1 Tax=Algibacter sp. 2305UL17-15 TaxID=3231268 RepID=UPI003459F753
MGHLERHLEKMNKLLHLSYEVENIYLDVYEAINDEDLKVFFRNTSFFRNEFSRVLRGEIILLGGTPIHFGELHNELNRFSVRIKKLIDADFESELLDQVCMIKKLSIAAYNDVLQERNLPLGVCKILIEQRDEIQKTLNTIRVEEQLVA